MSRRSALWSELFRLSWVKERRLTVLCLSLIGARVAVVALAAVSVRAAVNAAAGHDVGVAVPAAIGAALAYGLSLVISSSLYSVVNVTLDRVGRLELHARIHQDIASIEGIEHLERSDYLDRVTLARTASGKIMEWIWYSIVSVAAVLELLILLLLLGAVSPWLLLLVAFAAVPVWCNRRGQRVVTEVQLQTAELFRLQQELFELSVKSASAKEIKVAGAGPELSRRQAAAWNEVAGRRTWAQLEAALWLLAGWVLFGAAFTAGIGLVTYRTAHGQGTVGDLVLTVVVASSLQQSLQATVAGTLRTAGAGQVIEPYLWLRQYAAAQSGPAAGHRRAPSRLEQGLSLRGVTFRYPGARKPALDDVSVTLPAGKVVAVVGESGSGKSTLVKLLLQLYRPQSGQVFVDGADLAGIGAPGWRLRTSAVFQDFARLHTTVADSIGFGDLPALEDRGRLLAAFRSVDADDLIAGLPAGLDTQLGPELGGVDLSEGQWQRVALARASMREDPLLLVLDEPTASLDAAGEQAVFTRHMSRASLLAERSGAVTVVVSHRFSTVADADLILVMARGRIIESGTHATLLAHGGTYADLYTIQSNAYRSAVTP